MTTLISLIKYFVRKHYTVYTLPVYRSGHSEHLKRLIVFYRTCRLRILKLVLKKIYLGHYFTVVATNWGPLINALSFYTVCTSLNGDTNPKKCPQSAKTCALYDRVKIGTGTIYLPFKIFFYCEEQYEKDRLG
jgi:hypothetical protein